MMALLASGCGQGAGAATIADAAPFEGGACAISDVHVTPTSRNHLPQGTPIAYSTNPPCGGDHYPIWASWGAHAVSLPDGNWVHNLEHGGVALLYRCASRAACPALAASLEAVADSLPADPECVNEGSPSMRRVLVLPEPTLPVGVEIAAVAWGTYYTATCVEPSVISAFYDANLGHGAEQLCAQGAVTDGTFADAGSDAMTDAGETGVETSADGSSDVGSDVVSDGG
jgi:hypothetical protein